MSTIAPSTYLRRMLAAIVLGSAAAAAVVVCIDPYGLYHVVERPGFNAVKPPLTRHQEEVKLAHAMERHPATIIFGNSRAEIGLDPATLAERARPVPYNLAISGSSMAMTKTQLEALQAQRGLPSEAIIGMEFLDFLEGSVTFTSTPPRLDANAVLWKADMLFSMNSLSDALRTIAMQRDPEAESMDGNGFNPLREYRKFARIDGYRQIFTQRAQENVRTLLRKKTVRIDEVRGRALLRDMLDRLAAGGTAATLLVYPYHAQVLTLFEEAGVWPAFEQWKAMLADEVEQATARHPGMRIVLHDFSGYGPYQCERIPAASDRRSDTQWYWEGGHFKKALGDRMLATLRDPEAAGHFGMRLTRDGLRANAERIARERARCEAEYPELFDETRRLFRQTAGVAART